MQANKSEWECTPIVMTEEELEYFRKHFSSKEFKKLLTTSITTHLEEELREVYRKHSTGSSSPFFSNKK